MGCQPSIQVQPTQQSQSMRKFELDYGQFVCHDRGDIFQFYHFSKIINRSSTSLIRKVIHRTSKIQRICKIIPLTKKDSLFPMCQVESLKKLDHPNIVHVHQYYIEGNFLYIIMEYIPGIRLSNYINEKNGTNISTVISIMQQLLSAVEYCHNNGYVHRSIIPDNLLLVDNEKSIIVKLIDFSNSCVKDCPNPRPIKHKKNNIQLPPQFDGNSALHNLEKVDVWGVGFSLFTLLYGCRQFQFKKNRIKLIQQLKSHYKNLSKVIKLITSMTNQNPDLRPLIYQCLNDDILDQKIFNQDDKQRKQIMFNNLIKFKIENKLNSLLYMYASLNISKFNQKSQFLIQFHNLDRDGNGRISLDELVVGLENSFNISHQNARKHGQQIFQSLDKNSNGYIDYSQFVMGTMSIGNALSQQTIQKIFQQIDTNNDGIITEEELSNIVHNIDFKTLELQTKQITYCNFKKIMQSILQTKDPNIN